MEYKKVPIKNFEDYHVDTLGVIYGKKGNPLKPSLNTHGYLTVVFSINGKCTEHTVHRLVAEAFIANPENKLTINHTDGNKTNNMVSNLEWATNKEQMQHAFLVLNRNASNIRPIIGYNKYTNELAYEFSSLMEAGRYFAEQTNSNYRRCEQSI